MKYIGKMSLGKRLLALILSMLIVSAIFPTSVINTVNAAKEDLRTIYFTNNKSWSQVNAYMWNNEVNNTWPGKPMDDSHKNSFNQDVFKVTVDISVYDSIIFNGVQGSDQTPKTVNIHIGNIKNNTGYYCGEQEREDVFKAETWQYEPPNYSVELIGFPTYFNDLTVRLTGTPGEETVNDTITSGKVSLSLIEDTIYTVEILKKDMIVAEYKEKIEATADVTSKPIDMSALDLEVKPPVIQTQPVDQSSYFNEPVTFSIEASPNNIGNDGDISYQWQYDEGSGFNNLDSTSNKLTIPTADFSMSGYQYRCVISYSDASGITADSTTSNSAALTVNKRTPTLDLSADPEGELTFGTEVKLTAKLKYLAEGFDATGTIAFKDGNKILTTKTVSGNTAEHTYLMPVNHGVITAEYISLNSYYTNATGYLGNYNVNKKNQDELIPPTDTQVTYPSTINASVLGGGTTFTPSDTEIVYEIIDPRTGEATINSNTGVLTATRAGTFLIQATKPGDTEGNYNEVTVTYEVTVLPKKINIDNTSINVSSKIYDNNINAVFSGTPTVAPGSIETADIGKVTLLNAAPTFEDKNTSDDIQILFDQFALDGDNKQNYELIQPDPVALGIKANITKRTLTVTAQSQTIKYSEDIPLEVYVTGFAPGESESSLSGSGYVRPTADCSKTKWDAADTYVGAITVLGGNPTSNYEFEYVCGDLTINSGSVVKDTHYEITLPDGTNNWFKAGTNDFVITPKQGITSRYDEISTDKINWSSQLRYFAETENTTVAFYLRDSSTGAISDPSVTLNYQIDRTPPANLRIEYDSTPSLLDKILGTITFGYYKQPVTVTLTADDATSGVTYFDWEYKQTQDSSSTNVSSQDGRTAAIRIDGSNTYTAKFSLPGNIASKLQYNGLITFTATDFAGNNSLKHNGLTEDDISSGKTEHIIVVDAIAPQAEITINGPKAAQVDKSNENEIKADENTRFIYSGDVEFQIDVTDANFYPNSDPSNASYDSDDIFIEVEKTLDGIVTTYEMKFLATDWKAMGEDTWRLTKTITGDGNYVITVKYKDRSQNNQKWTSSEYDGKTGTYIYTSNILTIDSVAPVITISEWSLPDTASNIFNDERSATIQVVSRNFRPDEFEVTTFEAKDIQDNTVTLWSDANKNAFKDALKNLNGGSVSNVFEVSSWRKHTQTGELNSWEVDVKFIADARYEFAVEHTSLVGIKSDVVTAEPFIIDKTAPSNLTISYSTPLLEKFIENITFGYYKSSVSVRISAEDEISGVDHFNWTYTQQPHTSIINAATQSSQIDTENINYPTKAKTAIAEFTLTADELKQYRGSISFTATDKAQNTYDDNSEQSDIQKKDYKDNNIVVVDTINPQAKISYSGDLKNKVLHDPKTGIPSRDTVPNENVDDTTRFIYSSDITAVVEIIDANFYPNGNRNSNTYDADDVSIEILKTLDKTTTPYKLDYTADDWKQDKVNKDKWTLNFPISGDGDYNITIKHKDRSQNSMDWKSEEYNGKSGTEIYKSNTLTIDTVDPVIIVDYVPSESLANAETFNKDRVMTVQITDRNFRPYEITPIFTAKDIQNNDVDNIAEIQAALNNLKNWSSWTQKQQNVWETKFTFSENANYTFGLIYQDLAQRKVTYSATPFTIDHNAPNNLTISYSKPSLLEKVKQLVTFGYYNPSVTVVITADDVISGVDKFNWTYTQEPGTSISNVPSESAQISAENITYSNKGKTATASFTLTADKADQYRGSIEFSATNRAGNKSSVINDKSNNIIVADTINPQVKISYDGNLVAKVLPDTLSGKNGSNAVADSDVDDTTRFIYSDKIIAAIEVTEANFYPNDNRDSSKYDEDDILITVERTYDGVTLDYPLNYLESDWNKNGDTWTLKFELPDDGDYVVRASYKDRSQNNMEWTSDEFKNKSGVLSYTSNKLTIDTSPPETRPIKYSISLLDKIINAVTFGYYNPSVTVTLEAYDVTAVDHFNWTYTQQQDTSTAKNVASETAQINAEDITYSNDGKIAVSTFTLLADEVKQYRGSIAFTATDKAGYTSVVLDDKQNNAVVVDTIAPQVKISYDGNLAAKVLPDPLSGKNGSNSVAGNDVDKTTRFIYSDKITAAIEVSDANFYPNGSRDSSNFDEDDILITAVRTYDGVTLDYPLSYLKSDWKKDGDTWTLKFELPDDGDYVVRASYKDRSQNKMEWTSDEFQNKSGVFSYISNKLTVDTSPPETRPIKYSTSLLDKIINVVTFGYYNPSVTVTLEAYDVTASVDHFNWTYTQEHGTSTAKNVASESKQVNAEDIIYSNNGKTAVSTFTLTADEVKQYRGSIAFTAADKAGYSSEILDDKSKETVIVDNISPTRTVTYSAPKQIVNKNTLKTYEGNIVSYVNNENTSSIFYYDGSVTATVKITEANFYPDDVSVKVNGKTVSANWKKSADDYTATITLSGDGDYIMSISYTDRSTNSMVDYKSEQIVIDTINPEVSVAYKSADIVNQIARPFDNKQTKYYDAVQTATITIKEHNFRADDVAALITAKDITGKNIEASLLARLTAHLSNRTSWTKNGDRYTAVITYSADANYTFDIDYSDLSLRRIKNYTPDVFTVDTTAPSNPTISYSKNLFETVIAGVTFGYYNPKVTVTITAEDNTSGIHRFVYNYIKSKGVSDINAELLNQALSNAQITHNGKIATAAFDIPKTVLTNNNQFNGTIEFTAFDRSENSTNRADNRRLVVDNVAPSVDVTYNDPVQKLNEISYYSTDINATINITEANFYSQDVSVEVTKDGAAVPVNVN